MNYDNLEFHELADLFPLTEGEDQVKLAQDIKDHGLIQPITLCEGKILDGRNRYRAAKMYGTALGPENFEQFEEKYPDLDPVEFVISKNIRRRHLTVGQRAALATELYERLEKRGPGQPKKELSGIPENTLPSAKEQKKKAAKAADSTIDAMETFGHLQKAAPEKAKEVKAGTKSLHKAETELKAKKPEIKDGQTTKVKDKLAFDAVGVSEYIKDKAAFNLFRKLALDKGLPFKQQSDLAANFLDWANTWNKGVLSRQFIEAYWYAVDEIEIIEKEQIHPNAQRERENAMGKWTKLSHHLCRSIAGMAVDSRELIKLKDQYPKFVFRLTQELRRALGYAAPVIEELAQKFGVKESSPKPAAPEQGEPLVLTVTIGWDKGQHRIVDPPETWQKNDTCQSKVSCEKCGQEVHRYYDVVLGGKMTPRATCKCKPDIKRKLEPIT